MMIRKYTTWVTPGIADPPEVGNQERLERYVMIEPIAPIARPATVTTENDMNRANRAAASAGITASAIVFGSSCVIGATRIPTPPAITNPSVVLIRESFAGRQTGEHRLRLMFRRCSRRDTEGRIPVGRPEDGGQGEHDAGEDEPVIGHGLPEYVDRGAGRLGKDRWGRSAPSIRT